MMDISEVQSGVNSAKTHYDLANYKANILGKNGFLAQEFAKMKNLSGEEKRLFGLKFNEFKILVEGIFLDREWQLKLEEINNKLANDTCDISTPIARQKSGKIHPVSFIMNEIEEFFSKYGFTCEFGPEIEDDYHNFEALNFPELHPARNMHDTFYISEKNLLRTHTSSVQIRFMQKNKPPFRFLSIGKTYRCDSDKTHTPMFHQAEGLCIGEDINMGNMKCIISEFLKSFFKNAEVRMRPSFFPFTEPSCEIDINIGNGWLEVMGCGMVHQNVLKNCNIDHEKYQGFAFGMGIERLVMLKYGMTDLREFFSPKIRWLEHFGF